MKRYKMMDAFVLSVLGAGIVATASAAFGVGMARLVWADDLKHAVYIDEIRSRTEASLRASIKSLESQIAILQKGR